MKSSTVIRDVPSGTVGFISMTDLVPSLSAASLNDCKH